MTEDEEQHDPNFGAPDWSDCSPAFQKAMELFKQDPLTKDVLKQLYTLARQMPENEQDWFGDFMSSPQVINAQLLLSESDILELGEL